MARRQVRAPHSGSLEAVFRASVLQALAWIGVELDAARNRAHAPVISTDASRVRVFVIRTNEESMLAEHTARAALA